MSPSHLVLPVVVALVAAVSGCGGDGDSRTASAPAVPTAPSPEAASSTTASAPARPGAKRVEIEDFEYAPGKLTVAAGTRVTWTNADLANHTVTFDAGSSNLGNQAKGKAVSRTFEKAGSYAYHCDYHPNMKGTVVVR